MRRKQLIKNYETEILELENDIKEYVKISLALDLLINNEKLKDIVGAFIFDRLNIVSINALDVLETNLGHKVIQIVKNEQKYGENIN